MIDLPKILNSRSVRDTIPDFLDASLPYARTISGKFFNQKRVVDFAVGTRDIQCNCGSSDFCYGPVGHVVTGDLSIIRDMKLRQLIAKGPSYREQNNVNWNWNAKICEEAVSKYEVRWSKKEGVDQRVLNEWENKVHECIDWRIQLRRAKTY